MERPVIGVTPGYNYENNTAFVRNGYCEGIIKAGGLPVIIPFTADTDVLSEVVRRCDGFLAAGGSDLDAKLYGERNLPFNGDISPERDSLEMFIIKEAIRRGLPILGICRGIQAINVAMGGTLYQDICSQIKDREVVKHSQDAPKWYPTHEVYIEKGSQVYAALPEERIGVNSFHHQAVKDAAPGFRISARSEDGVIEAIELPEHPFTVGVQWHPELMWQRDERFLGLFTALINACK